MSEFMSMTGHADVEADKRAADTAIMTPAERHLLKKKDEEVRLFFRDLLPTSFDHVDSSRQRRRANGKTMLRDGIKAGCESFDVMSSVELFGKHVKSLSEEGRYTIKMTNPRRPLTVQIGKDLTVNVHSLHNNTLFVTPISVKHDASEGASVFFGSGPALESDGGRIDMDKLKAEVEELSRIGVYGEESKFGDYQKQSQEMEAIADSAFWEGMQAERAHNVERIIYNPIMDCEALLDFSATCKYKESLSCLNQALKLDKTRIDCYAKRAVALGKLAWFDRALEDGKNYVTLRPESPTGHCIKGVAHQGMKQYNLAIDCLHEGLKYGEVAYYDKSRVWSTGTDLRKALNTSTRSRDSRSQEGRVANAQGMQWCAIGRYNEALKCLREGVDATSDSLGKHHLSYATCVNNLGACFEAMGKYDDAMKTYNQSLRVTELGAPGNCRVLVLTGRHLPTTTFPGGERECIPYVRIEHASTSAGDKLTGSDRTVVRAGSRQPVWNHLSTLHHPSAYFELTVSLMCEHPAKAKLRDDTVDQRGLIASLEATAGVLSGEIGVIEARVHRLTELGGLKVAELNDLEAKHAERRELLDAAALCKGRVRDLEAAALAADDVTIGSFKFDVAELACRLDGQKSATCRAWFETLNDTRSKVRGDDFGVTAVELEIVWEPESVEYATRLANIGNLHRIIGCTYTSRGGGQDNIKKLDESYQTSQDFLTAALEAMITAKSAVPTTEAESVFATLAAAAKDKAGTAKKKDGQETPEACLILENLGRLLVARGLTQNYPKGTTAQQKAHFESVYAKSRRQGLQVLERAAAIRKRLSGESCEELMAIRGDLVRLHVESGNFNDALPVQEANLEAVKKRYGGGSEEWVRELNFLNEVHHALGDTTIRTTGEAGRWIVDASASWHWQMVPGITRKVTRAATRTHVRTGAEDKGFEAREREMEEKRVWLHEPPKIEDYSLVVENAARKLAGRMEALEKTGKFGGKGEMKRAVAVASKLKTPDVALVRLDAQFWPNNALHTKTS